MATPEGISVGSEPIDHLILSVDTSETFRANWLMQEFKEAGGSTVKLGLEAASAFGGPEGLSHLAEANELDWVYDGKIKDIGSTMAAAVANVVSYPHQPKAITLHADTSFKGMKAAQEAAGDVTMLGVSLLTDISPEEAYDDYTDYMRKLDGIDTWLGEYVAEYGGPTFDPKHEELRERIVQVGEQSRILVVMERALKLGRAGVRGLVASPKELEALAANDLTSKAFKMIPGTRSLHAQANDQKNTMTPEDAIANGADLLVIGRQYTNADDKAKELELLQEEVARGLERRAA